jgi:hypothetical protein
MGPTVNRGPRTSDLSAWIGCLLLGDHAARFERGQLIMRRLRGDRCQLWRCVLAAQGCSGSGLEHGLSRSALKGVVVTDALGLRKGVCGFCLCKSDTSRPCNSTTVKRPGWERRSVIRNLFGGLVLACTCLSSLAGGAPKISSMRFEWRGEQPGDLCRKACHLWISAVGPVTDRTPDEFEAFAKQKDVGGATLVIPRVVRSWIRSRSDGRSAAST